MLSWFSSIFIGSSADLSLPVVSNSSTDDLPQSLEEKNSTIYKTNTTTDLLLEPTSLVLDGADIKTSDRYFIIPTAIQDENFTTVSKKRKLYLPELIIPNETSTLNSIPLVLSDDIILNSNVIIEDKKSPLNLIKQNAPIHIDQFEKNKTSCPQEDKLITYYCTCPGPHPNRRCGPISAELSWEKI